MALTRSASADPSDLELGLGDARARQQGQPGEDAEHGERTYDLKLDGPLSKFFGQELYVNIFVLLSVILLSVYNHKNAGILSWSFSGISMACLVVSLVLHLAAKIFTCDWIQKVKVRCNLAYLSVFLRVVAATFLLLFMDPVRHMVVILPLLLLVLVLLAYFWKTFGINRPPPAGKLWGQHEAELKLRFDLSSQVVTFAFAGLLGTVIGYVKEDSSNQLLSSRGRGYMAPDCFLSYSILLGLLVQLFSTMPTYIFQQETRKRMAKVYLRIVAYASLTFLVLASVMAAEEILQEWVFIACFIIVIIPVIFFWMENRNGPNWFKKEKGPLLRFFKKIPSSIRDEQDYDKAAQVFLTCLTSFFAALMASNSKYSIEGGTAVVSLSGWFKCSVLLELYGVLSYAVRMVVLSEMPEMKSLAFPKMVWNLSAIATITFTIILIVAVVLLHPDEMKNIF